MEKNKITVKIEGLTATGKSSITWAIIKTLKEYGLDVKFEAIDHNSIEHLQNSMEHDMTLSERLKYLSEKTDIVVKEIQLKNT